MAAAQEEQQGSSQRSCDRAWNWFSALPALIGRCFAGLSARCLLDNQPACLACKSARAFHARQAPTKARSLFLTVFEPVPSQASAAHLTALSPPRVPPLRLHRSSCLPAASRRAERARRPARVEREMKSRKSLFVVSECDLRSLLPNSSPRRQHPHFLHSAFRTSSNT